MIQHDRSLYYGIGKRIAKLPHYQLPGLTGDYDIPEGQVLSSDPGTSLTVTPGQPVPGLTNSSGSTWTAPSTWQPTGDQADRVKKEQFGGQPGYTEEGNPIQPPDELFAEIQNAFNSRIGALNQAADRLRGAQPGIESDILAEAETSRKALDTERGVSERELQRQEEAGTTRKEDALTAARRLYNELSAGGQQRFGGSSSAGEAYQALTGRELQRNQAQIGKDYASFMGQVEGARTDLRARFDSAIANLEQKRQSAINQSRRIFQDKLSEIDLLKGQAEEDKALRRLGALQDYRNQIFQINLASQSQQQQITDFTSALDQQLTNTQTGVTSTLEGVGDAGATFTGATTTDPQTSLSMSGPQTAIGRALVAGTPTGRLDQFGLPKDEDDIYRL